MVKSTKPAPAPATPPPALGDNWGPIDTEFVPDFDLTALVAQQVNARFMTAAQMAQLTDNIRRDGVLTSAILAYRDPESGVHSVVSGHHRKDCALAAEVTRGPVIVITTPLTLQRLRALQLAHNAITGQDDLSTLRQMFAGLDLAAKSYSGVDDAVLGNLGKVTLGGLGVSMKYQEMQLFFLDQDATVVEAALERISKAAKKKQAYVAAYRDYDEFFEVMVRGKHSLGAFNSAITFRLLCDLATAKLDEIEAAAAAEEPASAD